ncbi:MAG: PilZ domain-containing protein [bacterium]
MNEEKNAQNSIDNQNSNSNNENEQNLELQKDNEESENGENGENDTPVLVDFKYSKAKERRKEERRILEPARLVRIIIYYSQDFIVDKWVSVVDISRHGMKIISDIPLKLEDNVKIEFYVSKEPVSTEGRIAWCKELIRNSGLYAVGLDLAKLKDADYETIDKFLINFAPFEERRAVRVKKPFLIEVRYLDEVQKFYTYAVDLSITGMRIINDFELPVDQPILIKAILGNEETDYIKAKVVWQQEKSFGVVIGLNFIEANNDDIKKIEDFIYSP